MTPGLLARSRAPGASQDSLRHMPADQTPHYR
jgi:hypothetical protein